MLLGVQFLDQKFYNASHFVLILYQALDFEFKNLQLVSFQNNKIKKCQILKRNFYNQRITFMIILLRKKDIICNFRLFLKNVILTACFNNVSVFELKSLQRVRF